MEAEPDQSSNYPNLVADDERYANLTKSPMPHPRRNGKAGDEKYENTRVRTGKKPVSSLRTTKIYENVDEVPLVLRLQGGASSDDDEMDVVDPALDLPTTSSRCSRFQGRRFPTPLPRTVMDVVQAPEGNVENSPKRRRITDKIPCTLSDSSPEMPAAKTLLYAQMARTYVEHI